MYKRVRQIESKREREGESEMQRRAAYTHASMTSTGRHCAMPTHTCHMPLHMKVCFGIACNALLLSQYLSVEHRP